ncbi:hypothetical protein [Mesorhizobium argentiipisi]|uniref:Uncharacterized protein n=1 Tax=Mesorhizobium argentiipisi TaxID=3015175 RepID=A0ABU8KMI1_9HYPH
MAAVLNIIGLVLSFAGVIILFRYGMPFKVRTGGASHIILEQIDEAEVELEARYDKYGQGGLLLVFLGTAFQIAANVF